MFESDKPTHSELVNRTLTEEEQASLPHVKIQALVLIVSEMRTIAIYGYDHGYYPSKLVALHEAAIQISEAKSAEEVKRIQDSLK